MKCFILAFLDLSVRKHFGFKPCLMYFAWRSNCSKAVAAGEAFERGHLTKTLNSGLSLDLSSSCDNFVICFFLKDYIRFQYNKGEYNN